jgi:hypothetical protein
LIPKFKYFRSKQHLKNVASLECQNCGVDNHTQAAHSNWAEHGKGRAIKASDEFTAALCVRCHFQIDQGTILSKEQRRELWEKAWRKTVAELQQSGKWPSEVKIDSLVS